MGMSKSPTEIAQEYLASLRRSAAGEAGSHEYLDFWADEIEYILPGLWPMNGVFSKAEYIEKTAPMMESNVEGDGDRIGEPGTGPMATSSSKRETRSAPWLAAGVATAAACPISTPSASGWSSTTRAS